VNGGLATEMMMTKRTKTMKTMKMSHDGQVSTGQAPNASKLDARGDGARDMSPHSMQ
jgi:hypothetical protein